MGRSANGRGNYVPRPKVFDDPSLLGSEPFSVILSHRIIFLLIKTWITERIRVEATRTWPWAAGAACRSGRLQLLDAALFKFTEGVDADAFVLGGGRFLNDVRPAQVDFLVDVFRNDVVPVGKAGVEFIDAGGCLLLLVFPLVHLAAVLFADPLGSFLGQVHHRRRAGL